MTRSECTAVARIITKRTGMSHRAAIALVRQHHGLVDAAVRNRRRPSEVAEDFGLYDWRELPAFIKSVSRAGHVPHKRRPSEAEGRAILSRQVRRHVYFNSSGVLVPVNPGDRRRRDLRRPRSR